jgi:hypothetical protein
MKNLSKLFLFATLICGLSTLALAQQVNIPRPSPKAEIMQMVGDTKIAIVYHRPSIKNRKVFGAGNEFLVPYGEVWRTGANDATLFEVSEDVTINGSKLAAGKYTVFSIPNKDEWTVIFNKQTGQWGTVYQEAQDALRVKVKPQSVGTVQETMVFDFETVAPTTATLVMAWDKTRLPLTIDIGDVNTRVLAKVRKAVADAPADNQQAMFGARMTGANFILDNKIKDAYPDAAKWIDESLKMRENFTTLRAKARIAAEQGNFKDAVTFGEKAIATGKAATPPINADFLSGFEKEVAEWKKKS